MKKDVKVKVNSWMETLKKAITVITGFVRLLGLLMKLLNHYGKM